MIAKKMEDLVKNGSAIRAMFEEGAKMAEKYGAENVFDFSLGNPSVEPPHEVKEAMIEIITKEEPNKIHGYMNNSGYKEVRECIAKSLNQKYNTNFSDQNIIMTVGAAGGLNVILKTLLNPEDEVIVFVPYFGEYKNYVENFQGKLIEVPTDTHEFQPDLSELEKRITKRTKAIIINTPNNPTGVVYPEKTIQKLAEVMEKKQKEFSRCIYLISDEPYRELVYGGVEIPYLTKYYKNTIVAYSYSKSLSLPGERIGYLVIPSEVEDQEEIINAAGVANRILGFVNAPSLIQLVVAKCINIKVDIEPYDKNRLLLYYHLKEYGYICVKPEGAFYLFVKTPEPDDRVFVEAAKKYHLLLVPGSSFGCPGYCRIAYCVPYERIERALPYFKQLAKDYGLNH